MYNASDVIGTDSQHPGLVPVIGSTPGTNGNTYASTPVDPAYVEGPSSDDYIKGVPPLETLPAQWWNWLNGEYTKRFNNMSKQNGVLDNLFEELNNVLLDKGITPNANSSNQLVTALNKTRRTIITTETIDSVVNGEVLWFNTANPFSITLPTGANPCDIIIIHSNSSTHEINGSLRDGTISLGWGESIVLIWHGTAWVTLTASISYIGKRLYPLGTIYQNADDDTQPQQLLGFGYWTKITDRFLASYGSSIITKDVNIGGRSEVILNINNLPAHYHNATFTGTRLNVNDAFWAVTQLQVGVNPGSGQATLVDNKSPFKNANFHNYTNKAVTTYAHTGIDVDCLSGGIGFDYTPEGTVTTENTGEGEAFSIIPPYYAVHTWKRIS